MEEEEEEQGGVGMGSVIASIVKMLQTKDKKVK